MFARRLTIAAAVMAVLTSPPHFVFAQETLPNFCGSDFGWIAVDNEFIPPPSGREPARLYTRADQTILETVGAENNDAYFGYDVAPIP